MKNMTVFISWSKQTSKEIALILKDALSDIFVKKIDFWVSDNDITAGSLFVNQIINELMKCQMIITVLDSMNFQNPWLYFENGIVFSKEFKQNHVLNGKEIPFMFPIVFDSLSLDEFKGTPFGEFQLSRFNKESLFKLANAINNQYYIHTKEYLLPETALKTQFSNYWNKIEYSINTIIRQKLSGDENMIDKENVTKMLEKYFVNNLPETNNGDIICYSFGFETEIFYKFLLENTKKRLYIFGRKNRKLTSFEFDSAFDKLLSKNDFDLKILYINPDCESSINGSAQDVENFRHKLISSMQYMNERLKKIKKTISEYCRMYSINRDSEIIVADNVVFYKDLGFSLDGKPLHFTNCSFSLTSINSTLGSYYCNKFQNCWNDSTTEIITTEYINKIS